MVPPNPDLLKPELPLRKQYIVDSVASERLATGPTRPNYYFERAFHLNVGFLILCGTDKLKDSFDKVRQNECAGFVHYARLQEVGMSSRLGRNVTRTTHRVEG